MQNAPLSAVYGAPPKDLADVDPQAIQVSPLTPGATTLDDLTEESLDALVMLAPFGTLERRYALAQTLRTLKPGGTITVMAPKDKGGARLGKELASFGCAPQETAKRHHRVCVAVKPAAPAGLDAAIVEGGPRRVESTGLWSQPGVFSWDRIDPGSALLAGRLPALSGHGADLGCGVGYLAHAILKHSAVEQLEMVDIDRRAIAAAQRNVADPRAVFHWADVANGDPSLEGLDFVVMNPPFHDAGVEDRGLGSIFITRAARMLRKGGVCWLVANRHLPYEAALALNFSKMQPAAESGGYKIYEAIR